MTVSVFYSGKTSCKIFTAPGVKTLQKDFAILNKKSQGFLLLLFTWNHVKAKSFTITQAGLLGTSKQKEKVQFTRSWLFATFVSVFVIIAVAVVLLVGVAVIITAPVPATVVDGCAV